MADETGWRSRFHASAWPTRVMMDCALRLVEASEEHLRGLDQDHPSARRSALHACGAAYAAFEALWPAIPDPDVPYLPKRQIADYAAYTGLDGAVLNALGRDKQPLAAVVGSDAYKALAALCREPRP